MWGFRWMARWYMGVGLVAALAWVGLGASRDFWVDGLFGTEWTGARRASQGAACLLSDGDAPRVDAATGLVVLPSADGYGYSAEWNDGVRAALRRDGSLGPTFRDRIVDPRRIAAAFDRDPGADVGNGSVEFDAGGVRVRVEEYDCNGCGTGVPDRLRVGDRDVPIGGVLRVRGPEGGRRNAVVRHVGRGVAWFPSMASMRARTSDDGRTLWLRGEDGEGHGWIVTADLVTGTVLQIDPDPAR